MKRAERERLSVRIALAVGFFGTLGLWLYTSYAFTQTDRDGAARRRQVAARYTRAQELLATVRAQVLLSSVRVRDALLDPTPAALHDYREQLEASSHIIDDGARRLRAGAAERRPTARRSRGCRTRSSSFINARCRCWPTPPAARRRRSATC